MLAELSILAQAAGSPKWEINWTVMTILIIANTPIYIVIGWLFFRDWHGFFEAIRFVFTPEIISAFRGEYWEDLWQSVKLVIMVAWSIGTVAAEYYVIAKYLL
ncbi:MAG: hypothetical protein ACYS8W_07220 [Planctomycetota bacterium]|jgi:hypothetical protein